MLLLSYLISQDTGVGSAVLRVVAGDADSTSNGVITYRIVNGGSAPFAIDATTGLLTTTQTLDREATTEYNVRLC